MKNVFLKQDVSLGLDAEILAEIGLYDATLAKEIQAFEKELGDRFLQISSAFTSHVWTIGKAISEIPAIKLEELAVKLDRDADIFAESAKAETRLALVEKFEELDAKLRFSPRKDDVLAVIEKKRRKEILEKCLGAVKTNSISLKAKEVAEKIITRDLADALNTEFNNLGVGNLNVELKSRSDHGKPLFKLKLNLPQSENPSNILSEGEQRAIAIGSFLAEVNLSGGLCGIIFDDPVSSLDHRRRELVARRFASEASKRQVIVFTHDLYFLCILIEEAENAGVAVESRTLIKKSCGFGVPEMGNPFEGMSTKDRISFLRSQHQGIKKLFKNGDDLEYRKRTIDAYQLLRDTWERFVEEVLFGSVVIRFRKGVETQRLKQIKIEESDYIVVDKGMTKCSNYSHDKALMGGIAVPEPDELSKDIEMLESFRSEIVERSKTLVKSRK